MDWMEELALCWKARVAVVNLVTRDEAWVLRRLVEAAARGGGEAGFYTWDLSNRYEAVRSGQPELDTSPIPADRPDELLKRMLVYPGAATIVLRDAHLFWEGRAIVVRAIRNLAQRLPAKNPPVNVVLLTPTRCLPEELKNDVVQIECPIPDEEEMSAVLRAVIAKTAGLADTERQIVKAALGLSAAQAGRMFRKAMAAGGSGALDERCIPLIAEEKRAVLKESGALEFCARRQVSNSVGGLEELRRWLRVRKQAFSRRAHDEGLEAPRGLALIGIPGTGKSLCARLTAELWNLPLLRLDMGAVFSGVLGSSEQNMRNAIRIAEIVAPCILWVDEVEKSFAGSGGDGGAASRVLATFLTWMQEKTAPAFVFATANDVTRLPPEFLRKGRFDEVFFLDLPTTEERKAILNVHLKARIGGMPEEMFDLDSVVKATEGFVGAELEALVKDAKFKPFLEERPAKTEDLIEVANDMVPLAKARAREIEELRKIVTCGQARNASRGDAKAAVALDRVRGERAGRALDV